MIAAISAALLLWSCKAKLEEKKEEAEAEHVVTVDVAPVTSSPIQLKVTAEAVLYPPQQASIVPKITAPVKKFYVDKGSVVREGQLLAELENRDLASAVAESKAAYDQAEATYESTARGTVPEDLQKAELEVRAAKDTMDTAQKLYESRQALFKEGAIAQREVNDAQAAFSQARTQHEIAQKHLESLQNVGREQTIKGAAAQRDAAKAHYETAQVQLGYSRITSPINGVVTDRSLYAGELASSSAPLVTVMDVSQIIARAHVAPDGAAKLKVGDPANIIPPDASNVFAGKVTVISPALDPTNTTVEVWVQAPNPGNKLKPGSAVRVEAIAQTVPNALVIPYAAVLTSQSGSTSVMVVDSENKPHKKSIMLGIRDGAKVQVTEGLESGERVITEGAFELSKLEPEVLKATKVEIQPPKEEEEEDEK